MQESASSHEDNRRQSQAIPEFDILWITAGLGCDGDTIAMTAATQPSIEEILLGGIPWIPKVRLHNPFLTYDNGAEFMEHFYSAAAGKLSPFILVIEGSIPDETNKKEGYWASFGTDAKTGQPILQPGYCVPALGTFLQMMERLLVGILLQDVLVLFPG